jgi:hypothetical protein
MQVEAIYNQGTIQLVHPLRLKHDRIRLTLIVPDEEVESEPVNPVTAAAPSAEDSMDAQVRAILSPYQHLFDRAAKKEPLDYDKIRDDYLTEKYLSQK